MRRYGELADEQNTPRQRGAEPRLPRGDRPNDREAAPACDPVRHPVRIDFGPAPIGSQMLPTPASARQEGKKKSGPQFCADAATAVCDNGPRSLAEGSDAAVHMAAEIGGAKSCGGSRGAASRGPAGPPLPVNHAAVNAFRRQPPVADVNVRSDALAPARADDGIPSFVELLAVGCKLIASERAKTLREGEAPPSQGNSLGAEPIRPTASADTLAA